MQSTRPKVLHDLAGRPLLDHVLRAVEAAGARQAVVVVGAPGGPVEEWLLQDRAAVLEQGRIVIAYQAEPRGTGHAVQCALPEVERVGDPIVVILNGDVPMVRSESLKALAERTETAAAGLGFATFRPEDPAGYGRVIRNARGRVEAIREHRNCTPDELRIEECNVGLYAVRLDVLLREIPKLQPQPPADEVYLTDLVHQVAASGEPVTVEVDPIEAAGINTQDQLRRLERRLQAPR